MNYPKVFIIILNWNGLQDTLECLESVSKLNYPNYRVIVVDNGSTDDSVKIISKISPKVILLPNAENLGFAAGNNIGIRKALEQGVEYIWLLNNDTTVHPDALLNMIAEAKKDPDIGIVGSKIYYYGSAKQIWFAGAKIDWSRGSSNHIGLGETDTGQYDYLKQLDRVTGCSMLVNRTVCDKAGLLDEDYFLYAEDVDWCVRAKKAGFKCIFAPLSIVYHKVYASTKDNKPTIFSYYNTRNMLYAVRKNCSSPWREIYIFTIISSKIWSTKREIIKYFIVRLTRAEKYSYNLSTIHGIVDFVFGRMGQVNSKKLLHFSNRLTF